MSFHLLPIAEAGEREQVALIPSLGVTVAGEEQSQFLSISHWDTAPASREHLLPAVPLLVQQGTSLHKAVTSMGKAHLGRVEEEALAPHSFIVISLELFAQSCSVQIFLPLA